MKKYIVFAALILLFLQFSPVTYEFTGANAQAVVRAAEENIVHSDSVQKFGSVHITTQGSSWGDAVVSMATVGANENDTKIIRLASNPNGTANDNTSSSDNYSHDFLLYDFWNRYNEYIILISIIIIIGSVLVAFNNRERKKQYTLLVASEGMLRNITNNINGGVLVLNPQKEFQVSYLNDGFLKLIGYSKEEIYNINAKDYYLFIHHDDRSELAKLIMPVNQTGEQDSDFSIQLRIKGKDGKYVPTLVKGSLVRNEQGKKELFCVVMDISGERAMMEELQFEQERHKILLEKSDEILFEINYVEQTVKVSPKFKEKFGWTLPKKYWGDEEPDLVNVYEDDRSEFAKALTEIYGGKIDGEFIARVCKSDGTPCWCKIFYHVMKTDDRKMQLIGKITDIDEEMKEKQALIKKAQVDALTGLFNKEAFKDRCVEYLTIHPDTDNAVVFFDVDNFKEINDSLGHAMGDVALRDISKRMQHVFSNGDILGRFGGDEFCVLMKDISVEELRKTLDELLEELRLEYNNGYITVSVSVSIGAVYSREYGNDFDQLLEYADKAQYFAKEEGKDGYALYNSELRLKGYEGRKLAAH